MRLEAVDAEGTSERSVEARRPAADVAWVALLVVLALAVLRATAREPLACAALTTGVLGLALWRWHTPRDLWLAGTALVLGPLLELAAVRTGLWTYRFSAPGLPPLWTLPFWALNPLALVHVAEALGRRPARGHLLLGAVIAALQLPALVLWGASSPELVLASSLVLSAAALVMTRDRTAAAMLAFSAAFGPVVELLPLRWGLWHYADARLLGMPPWLPTGYAVWGVCLVWVGLGLHGRRR